MKVTSLWCGQGEDGGDLLVEVTFEDGHTLGFDFPEDGFPITVVTTAERPVPVHEVTVNSPEQMKELLRGLLG